MIVYTTARIEVSIVHNNKKSLFDQNGTEWARDPARDKYDHAAYTATTGGIAVILLSKDQLKRVCQGDDAINTPTTVSEMRWYSRKLTPKQRTLVDNWSDQKLREILADAEESGKHPGTAMEKIAAKELEDLEPPAPEETPTKRATEASPLHEERPRHKNTPKRRKQEGSVSVALGEVSVLLTPKQLEFMERLSECQGWEDTGVDGEYSASEFAEEMSDTMTAMTVGAIVTTLREKGLLVTEKKRMGAIKCCVFRLTDTGKSVYEKLAKGEAL